MLVCVHACFVYVQAPDCEGWVYTGVGKEKWKGSAEIGGGRQPSEKG